MDLPTPCSVPKLALHSIENSSSNKVTECVGGQVSAVKNGSSES